ncbi:glucose-6-phosphate dehydrogenase, partial [Myxococcota bacterium]|nr:glucose-6-phosphate dehydrogenase [Myxococcota bacterium]
MKFNGIIALFGATGDLARGKLIGALYRLYLRGLLSETTPLLFIGRRHYSITEFIEFTRFEPKESPEKRDAFFSLWHYGQLDID